MTTCSPVTPPPGVSITKAQYGTLPWQGFTLNNDEWGPSYQVQTLWADSSSWGVVSQQPWIPYNVESYPSAIYDTTSSPVLSSFSAIAGTANETMPSDAHAEAAYDIWLNGTRGFEVMIWTDTHNVGPDPTGFKGNFSVGGVSYGVYTGTSGAGGGLATLVQLTNTTAQTTDIKGALTFLGGKGWAPANPVVSEIDYGWEIWGTANDCPENFTMNSYSLTLG